MRELIRGNCIVGLELMLTDWCVSEGRSKFEIRGSRLTIYTKRTFLERNSLGLRSAFWELSCLKSSQLGGRSLGTQ
ncbi:hypothetical protein BO94DRAFT_540712 [Aspergillus sclerotioniger CBS 115572]|uniref:Uncharacterized protein n=1 Tax=Aspergillus sclerotioniger CBS 115572 TaxID=1450535 RepID=A0A317V1T0_9EURO|nr:hypothetical protein BO94DRAFT_540712 [Aspergillus sclerotioniger CBS 115572]PWY66150.1 hypothetical protein BO94DRAFT_540712 [Aspergillus sclerotioniger CBS 115572]